MKLLFALATVCLVFVAAADAALVTASEMPVSPMTAGPAPFDQTQGRIATDGDTFLAVWVDRSTTLGDVLAMPLTRDGARMTDEPMLVAGTEENETSPAIAWGGDRYLIAWSGDDALHARIVARDRTMFAPLEIGASAGVPRIAFNGRYFLVMWMGPTHFRGALIDTRGAVVKTFDVAAAAGVSPEFALVAVQGTFYFVSAVLDFNGAPSPFGFPADVGVTAIDGNGNVATRIVLTTAIAPVIDLRAAAAASDLLAGWTTAPGIPGALIRTARFTPPGTTVLSDFATEGEFLYDVVARGNDYLFVYGNDAVKRLRGNDGGAEVVASNPPSSFNDVVSNGEAIVAIERTFGTPDPDLNARDLARGTVTPLAVAPPHQSAPDVAYSGGQRLVVWNENRTIRANGVLLDTASDHSAPKVAASNQTFLVVWRDGTDIAGMRLTRTGVAVEATAFGIASNVYDDSDVAVAPDANGWIVVYARGVTLRGPRTSMYAVRIGFDGRASQELKLSSEGANVFPAVASNGTNAFVVWRSGPFLQAALWSQSNTVTPVAFPSALPGSGRPAIEWNGSRYLIAAQANAPSGSQLQWLLATADGTVSMPATSYLPLSSSSAAVDVTLLGTRFLLAWNDGAALHAATLAGDGLLQDGPVRIATEATAFAAANGTFVYARHIDHPSRGITRVFTREVGEQEPSRRRAVRR